MAGEEAVPIQSSGSTGALGEALKELVASWRSDNEQTSSGPASPEFTKIGRVLAVAAHHDAEQCGLMQPLGNHNDLNFLGQSLQQM